MFLIINCFQPSHDGKQLKCVYYHEAWDDVDVEEEKEAVVNITIYCKYSLHKCWLARILKRIFKRDMFCLVIL